MRIEVSAERMSEVGLVGAVRPEKRARHLLLFEADEVPGVADTAAG